MALVEFSIRVNGGPEQMLTTKSGVYRDAAVAAIALLDLPVPSLIEIWVPGLLPEYGPYFYEVIEDEYGSLVTRHVVQLKN